MKADDGHARKIRVLHVLKVDGEVFGGVERMILNWYKYIDRERYQFCIVTPDLKPYGSFIEFRKKIEELGGECYSLGVSRGSLSGKIKYGKALRTFIKSGKYDIIHANSGVFFFLLQVAVNAKIVGAKKIIVHSHNACQYGLVKKILIRILRPVLFYCSDRRLCCSGLAGEIIFGKWALKKGRVVYLPNGIDIQKFGFNAKDRERVRKKFGVLEDELLLGNVGRFYEQKNHMFLIDIMRDLYLLDSKVKLMLVGEGELLSAVKKKVNRLDISDRVIFANFEDDIAPFYCAMDCLVLPSLYEGLGIVGIEAQASGIPVYYSRDVIPREIQILKSSLSIPLSYDSKKWAQLILSNYKTVKNRENGVKEVADAGFDIVESTKLLESIYDEK